MTEKACIICAEEGSPKIIKDDKFVTILDTYWKGVGVDVKPDLTKELSLCLPCYNSVLEFYQINDVLIYFEAKLRDAQMNILRKNIKGIINWQEKALKPMPFMHQILSKWGTKLEPVDEGHQDNHTFVTLTKENHDS